MEEEVKCVWRATLEGEGKNECLGCLCEESAHLEGLSAAWLATKVAHSGLYEPLGPVRGVKCVLSPLWEFMSYPSQRERNVPTAGHHSYPPSLLCGTRRCSYRDPLECLDCILLSKWRKSVCFAEG